MIRYLLTALILLVPAFARADEREDLLKQLAEINAKLDALSLTYDSARAKAIETGKPLVVFVGTDSRHVHGAIECQVYSLGPDYPQQCVVVSLPKNGELYWHETLPPNATDAQIQQAMRPRQVQPVASPFEQRGSAPEGVPADADDSPWLPVWEQNRMKALWPGSFPDTLKFYNLSRKYQKMYTMNGGSYKGNDITPLEDTSLAFVHSGGLAGIPGWKSTKGLAIPDGKKIAVWKENTDVRAFALVPRWRWRFPTGTVAYDVLTNNDSGRIFEVREMEKDGEHWYSHVSFKDEAQRPAGYTGLKSCAGCHEQPGQVADVPGKIYRHTIWGDDARFSWRPFDDYGNIDTRWPLEGR